MKEIPKRAAVVAGALVAVTVPAGIAFAVVVGQLRELFASSTAAPSSAPDQPPRWAAPPIRQSADSLAHRGPARRATCLSVHRVLDLCPGDTQGGRRDGG